MKAAEYAGVAFFLSKSLRKINFLVKDYGRGWIPALLSHCKRAAKKLEEPGGDGKIFCSHQC